MDGLLIIDKPAGPTSHDVVSRMRRTLRERRIGHTGTLDPGATGVLLLVLGKATRLAQFLSGSDKTYEAVVRLGFATDTADAAGEPIGSVWRGPLPSRDTIEAALDEFRGTFMQQPPAYSAKKIEGKRSHKLARARARAAPSDLPDPPDLPAPSSVTAYRVEIVCVEADCVTLTVDCSAGFYVRSLAHDLGERLGVGGHLASLRRTRTGDFRIDQAVDFDVVERDPDAAAAAVVPMAEILPGMAAVTLTADGVLRALHGREIRPADAVRGLGAGDWGLEAGGWGLRTIDSGSGTKDGPSTRDQGSGTRYVRLVDQSGALIGVATPAATPGALHPSVVLV
jgi:tRNA pseudouridine55 synthase